MAASPPPSRTRRGRASERLIAVTITACALASCALHGGLLGPGFQRPPELVAEWIDLRHTTPGDTALWVLRENGYDGSARIVGAQGGGRDSSKRTDRRYGTWYFSGSMSDSATRAICFARRIGREGATCLAFHLDTISGDQRTVRRLTIFGYQGERTLGDRELVERKQ